MINIRILHYNEKKTELFENGEVKQNGNSVISQFSISQKWSLQFFGIVTSLIVVKSSFGNFFNEWNNLEDMHGIQL